MKTPLKILGLGRCAIGHLRKNILQDQNDKGISQGNTVQFDHHYILNPFTIVESTIEDDDLAALCHAKCAPFLNDQFRCLSKADQYDVCIIEVFPPSRLYTHEKLNIYACFESFTDELQNLGFAPSSDNDPAVKLHTNPDEYVKSLVRLVQRLKVLNRNIRVILINSELLFEGPDTPISLPLLHTIFGLVRNKLATDLKGVSLLDMNDILHDLSKRGIAFFDTEFPLLYVRHDYNLNTIGVARDCKHASPYMRRKLVQAVYKQLLQDGVSLPTLGPLVEDQSMYESTFANRADSFLQIYSDPFNRNNPKLKDPRLFSRLVGYTLATNNAVGHDRIKKFIADLSQSHLKSVDDLVTYFYHLRSIVAYLHTYPVPLLVSLALIGVKILSLDEAGLRARSNFVLLWLKNIAIAIQAVLEANPHLSSQHIPLFLEKLKNRTFLQQFHEIQAIHNKLSRLFPSKKLQNIHVPGKSSQIQRIGIFLPRSTPLYMSMFFGLKRGFESIGVEVVGWSELLKPDALLEFCRQFNPDVIFEMNRSRHSIPQLPKDILHLCWLVDLMGNDYSYFKGSDIIYTFGSFWPQLFYQKNSPSHTDWLPPGVDPSCYYYTQRQKKVDFSFIGHVPLPWNQSELNRPLIATSAGIKTFGNFIDLYEKSWNNAFLQPTPPEILHRMEGRPDLDSQEIDIDDLTLRYDILCRSRRMKIRQSLIDAVMTVSDSIHIYGPDNWNKWPRYSQYYQRFIDNPHELRDVYQTTRLNLHEGISIHMRLLDCFASGGCLLYLDPDERNNTGNGIFFFFEKDNHYLEVERGDANYQVKEYLKNSHLCEQIGRNASEITLAHHTWTHRARKILSDCKYIRS